MNTRLNTIVIKASKILRGHVLTAEKFALNQKTLHDRLAKANAPQLMLQLIKVETLGGNCPKCDKPWKKIEVKNECADYTYYDPDCKCFPRCHGCGTSFHREWAMEERDFTKCQSCGYSSTPIYGRQCRKCWHWFLTEDPASDRHVICDSCKRPRRRSETGQKIDTDRLISVIREVGGKKE